VCHHYDVGCCIQCSSVSVIFVLVVSCLKIILSKCVGYAIICAAVIGM